MLHTIFHQQIDDEKNFYKLHIANTSTGNASVNGANTFFYNDGKNFSTIDANNDPACGDGRCSTEYYLG